MKKSQLIKIIKEEITKVLQEKTQEKLQFNLSDKDLTDIGVPDNVVSSVKQAIGRLRNPPPGQRIDDVPMSANDNKALARAFIELITSQGNLSKFSNFVNKIKSGKVTQIDR
jgi:hypothetical protein